MPGLLAEWRVTDSGWIQVSTDTERAGTALVNLAVDDLDRQLKVLAARHIAVGDIQEVNKGVRLAPIIDPDGNVITLIGNFREVY
jgi:glyoxylase I family protein